jgi:hypothetical protein
MTKSPAPRGAPKPRWAAVFGVLAGGVLLLAACGGSPGGTGNAAVAHLGTSTTTGKSGSQGGSSQSDDTSVTGGGSGGGGGPVQAQSAHSQFSVAGGNQSQMLAFSHCMQTHGVPNFPIPNSQGVASGSGLNPNSPSFEKAQNDCKHLLPNGGQPTAAQQAQAQAQALKFSQCMRSHGISDFPDPQTLPGGGIGIRIGGPGQGSSGLNPQSPQFQAAQEACQGKLGGPFGKGPKVPSNGGAK